MADQVVAVEVGASVISAALLSLGNQNHKFVILEDVSYHVFRIFKTVLCKNFILRSERHDLVAFESNKVVQCLIVQIGVHLVQSLVGRVFGLRLRVCHVVFNDSISACHLILGRAVDIHKQLFVLPYREFIDIEVVVCRHSRGEEGREQLVRRL